MEGVPLKVLAATMRIGVILACVLLALGLLFDPRLIYAGLAVLAFTPLSRILVLTRFFVRRREWPFAAISFGVLLLLVVSAILAA
jgi:uncharacterized membrane protein